MEGGSGRENKKILFNRKKLIKLFYDTKESGSECECECVRVWERERDSEIVG